VALTSVYLPTRYSDAIDKARSEPHTPVFSHVTALYGLVLKQIEQEITATMLSDDEAAGLQASAGSPALLITRRFLADDAELIEVTESLHPADRFVYVFRLSREK
jgi:GntR family transcriptional regulator